MCKPKMCFKDGKGDKIESGIVIELIEQWKNSASFELNLFTETKSSKRDTHHGGSRPSSSKYSNDMDCGRSSDDRRDRHHRNKSDCAPKHHRGSNGGGGSEDPCASSKNRSHERNKHDRNPKC